MTNEIGTYTSVGVKLLVEAISLYENNDLQAAYEKYQKAGKYLGEASQLLETEDGKLSMVYGGNRNFGVIYKVFENNTKELLKNKSSKKQLAKILNTIKENKVLMDEFSVYNAFTNPTNVEDADKYVNESISLIKHYSPETLKENNDKLINVIRECKLDENVTLTDEETELFEAIEYLIINEKHYSNLGKYSKIQKILCEHVNDNNFVKGENRDLDGLYEDKTDELVRKHRNELNEDEIKLIRDVTTNENKAKRLFAENQVRAMELVQKEIDKGEDADSWKSILESISGKVFNKNTALTDIAEFIEIASELED
jgi:hypothetical protein